MSICRILLVMPAASVAIASALRKNHSLGKTFWFTDNARMKSHKNRNSFCFKEIEAA
ncbi:MAG: hypothetical protein HCA25_20985 [Dolichospermum sp. DET50]|nr:hypothetical protein [Dolichospermum sp. DET67]MBS3039867.1 hypothetical protein [Dolichospermum sp. DET50]QSX67059.1 MAG: hypothetical protein EZY12_20255 [Dolichospermum sp. DET69]